MTTKIPTFAQMHGTRLRVVSVVPTAASPSTEPGWPQYPSVVALGGLFIDNNTGVSEVECRHR